jgi:phosphoglycerate dehydrogenase-like enzyme
MNRTERVAVCSRSFSKNPVLRNELLEKYLQVTFNDAGLQLADEELVSFLKGHDKAIIGLEKITEGLLQQLPELKVIGKFGVGLDTIDLMAMAKHQRRLGWTPGTNRRSVSELVVALTISMLRHVPSGHQEVLAGKWRQQMGGLLSGRTVGVIGCNNIGKDLITLLQPWGCKFLSYDLVDSPEFNSAHGVLAVGLEELLMTSDVITIHLPLNESTRNILSKSRISLMKESAILINTARGGLVDEDAMKEALKNQRLAGAAFDVFDSEPPQDKELLALPNFLVTPHIGGSTEEATIAMGRAAIRGLDENTVPTTGA